MGGVGARNVVGGVVEELHVFNAGFLHEVVRRRDALHHVAVRHHDRRLALDLEGHDVVRAAVAARVHLTDVNCVAAVFAHELFGAGAVLQRRPALAALDFHD